MLKKRILYISLTGMTEPLGRSQVLEYLFDLSKENEYYLISFERDSDLKNLDDIKELIKDYNITWEYFIYSNKYGIFSTISQIFQVMLLGLRIVRKNKIDIIHARSFIPATMGFIIKKFTNAKLLFDIRGFAIDEKIDTKRLNKNSFLAKTLKKLDNYLYQKSDHVVTLTHKAKEILAKNLNIKKEKITVIPTCANDEIFKTMPIKEIQDFKLELNYDLESKIIIHTGTVSGWYDFDKEVQVVKELMEKDSNINFLILNKNEQEFINNTISKYKLSKEKIKIMSSDFNSMYKYLNIADYSIFFIKPSYSKEASAPTKFAENVICHLPSITNSNVGDMEYYINEYNVGFLVDLNNINLDEITSRILNKSKQQFDKNNFENLFYTHFDKNMAVKKYQNIYESI
ncbi:glycosyltransferase [Poseidonibacter lekithochrous]|uniref:glycosyltransferase n=1 Tax=Poseidonibacter TaxID=2321187 RepID=UPI001C0A27F4|nr:MULTISPECIES: glycosyltransferase [Poseidonibacter]MBU3015749.1 glycosyltransferase [Poseidonibacter lekithochrous]MDO6829049.1 glycosyltransferase [Poseidonibacter sp. 1_MG-2023]